MQSVARKYDLYSKAQFSTQVKSLIWDEQSRKWNVTTFNKTKQIVEHFIFDIVYVPYRFIQNVFRDRCIIAYLDRQWTNLSYNTLGISRIFTILEYTKTYTPKRLNSHIHDKTCYLIERIQAFY
jgi:hypothetical protein